MGLVGKTLSAEQAIALMAKEPNLIKRPLVIAGKQITPASIATNIALR
jgi:arsenate reductase-like glutaredoxin family protein